MTKNENYYQNKKLINQKKKKKRPYKKTTRPNKKRNFNHISNSNANICWTCQKKNGKRWFQYKRMPKQNTQCPYKRKTIWINYELISFVIYGHERASIFEMKIMNTFPSFRNTCSFVRAGPDEETLTKEQVFRKLGTLFIYFHFKNRRALMTINQNYLINYLKEKMEKMKISGRLFG